MAQLQDAAIPHADQRGNIRAVKLRPIGSAGNFVQFRVRKAGQKRREYPPRQPGIIIFPGELMGQVRQGIGHIEAAIPGRSV